MSLELSSTILVNKLSPMTHLEIGTLFVQILFWIITLEQSTYDCEVELCLSKLKQW